MLHIHSIRITDGKRCYRPKVLKNIFVQNIEGVEAFEHEVLSKFIQKKYPNGIPLSRDLKLVPLVSNATYISIPNREFLHYLVAKLNYKTIPKQIINLIRKVK